MPERKFYADTIPQKQTTNSATDYSSVVVVHV